MEYSSASPQETKKIGEGIAKEILKEKKQQIFVLEGELGGGKTTFLQGFAKGLGIKDKILSPTFVMIKKFKLKDSNFDKFYHIDCYRIKKPEEILSLNLKEIISNPQNIVAIEWGEKIKKLLPPKTNLLKFDFLDKKKRKITWTKNA